MRIDVIIYYYGIICFHCITIIYGIGRASKRNFARRNKASAIGARGQAETSLKIEGQ